MPCSATRRPCSGNGTVFGTLGSNPLAPRPGRFATLLLCGSVTRYSMPVLLGDFIAPPYRLQATFIVPNLSRSLLGALAGDPPCAGGQNLTVMPTVPKSRKFPISLFERVRPDIVRKRIVVTTGTVRPPVVSGAVSSKPIWWTKDGRCHRPHASEEKLN